jgi:glycosyltransferase involved in cell wall biosynthesis
MMRILFTTDSPEMVSTQLNIPNLEKLNKLEGVSIDFYNRNYADYDIVLFMGYDARVTEARAAKPSLKIGVIDLRFINIGDSRGADFVIANGVEIYDWLANYFENIFIYPIYPQINVPLKTHAQNKPLIVCYHGNKLHLASTKPHVVAALEALSENCEVELWAVYDIRSFGEMPGNLCEPKNVKVRYFQWEEDVYEKVIAQADIGIVPNLIPLKDEFLAKKKAEPFSPLIPSNPNADYLLRFKKTTNAGRIYVFSQMGIPVVAGLSPSAAQAIQHGVNGYLALSTAGWYHGLKKLTDSAELRAQIGSRLYSDFLKDVAPDVLNHRLVEFIQHLPVTSSPLPFRVTDNMGMSTGTNVPRGLISGFISSAKGYFSRYFKDAGNK